MFYLDMVEGRSDDAVPVAYVATVPPKDSGKRLLTARQLVLKRGRHFLLEGELLFRRALEKAELHPIFWHSHQPR